MTVFRSALQGAVASAALLALCALPAAAATAPKVAKSASKTHAKTHKKAVPKAAPKPVEVAPAAATPEQVDAAERVYYGNYDCEFKQTVEIEKDPKYAAYVEVKNGKSHWLMKPVLSSTGAIRLEDVKGETLMVQISSKSMLLNVKTAQRIVDDCISAKQRELTEVARAAKAAEIAAGPGAPGATRAAPPLLLATPGDPAQAPGGTEATPVAAAASQAR